VGEFTVYLVVLDEPKRTALTSLKLVPLIVTEVPPDAGPEFGSTLVTIGTSVAAPASTGAESPKPSAPAIPTSSRRLRARAPTRRARRVASRGGTAPVEDAAAGAPRISHLSGVSIASKAEQDTSFRATPRLHSGPGARVDYPVVERLNQR